MGKCVCKSLAQLQAQGKCLLQAASHLPSLLPSLWHPLPHLKFLGLCWENAVSGIAFKEECVVSPLVGCHLTWSCSVDLLLYHFHPEPKMGFRSSHIGSIEKNQNSRWNREKFMQLVFCFYFLIVVTGASDPLHILLLAKVLITYRKVLSCLLTWWLCETTGACIFVDITFVAV